MKASESKLEPCPFCGSPAEITPELFGTGGYRIGCASKPTTCPGCIRWSAYYRSEEFAIAAWNRRAYEIKAEHKRENRTGEESSVVGNAEAMRKALDKLVNFLRWEYAQDYPVSRDKLADAIDIGVSALAATPRNCDVLSKDEVLEMLKDRSFSKEDTIEWLCDEAKGAAEWTV